MYFVFVIILKSTKKLLKEMIILIQGPCQLFLIFVFNNNMFENNQINTA